MSSSASKIDKDEFFASQDRYIHGEDPFYGVNDEEEEGFESPKSTMEALPLGKRKKESNPKTEAKKVKSEKEMKMFSDMKFCK